MTFPPGAGGDAKESEAKAKRTQRDALEETANILIGHVLMRYLPAKIRRLILWTLR